MRQKRFLLYAIIMLAVCVFAERPPIYSQVRVSWEYVPDMPGDIVTARPGVWADFVISEHEMPLLISRVIPHEVTIPDMAEHYARRLNPSLDMGGWRTYEMIHAALDSLHDEHPDLVSEPESIGCGHEGHAIWMVRISDNVEVDESEPEVLIGLGIHSREVIAMEIIVHFARWLVDNYGIDEVATHIIDKRETWFIPLMNPDGYHYNQVTNPTGGGMWRKNRRDNGGSYGVDLNRNFPYMWGIDDVGSSPTPTEETYRGPSAGSEPETQAIMNLVDSREFRTSLSFHSYSNLYLFPWGFTNALPFHNDWFNRIGYRYARSNGYVYGPSASTIYQTNGDTDDWLYGDTTDHGFIVCCTPEVGGGSDGFWPPLSRKPVLVEENMPVCIVCCQIAGSAPFMVRTWVNDSIGDTSGYADPGETVRLMVLVENLGFDPAVSYLIGSSMTSGVEILTDTAWTDVIPSQGYDTTYLELSLDESHLGGGDIVKMHFEIRDTSGHLTVDSSMFICGTPITLSSWDFEGSGGGLIATGDWEWGEPESGPENAYSGSKLWGTVLDDDYSDDTESQLITPPVAIPDSAYRPRLTLANWYSMEAPGSDVYDGGTVRITSDGGMSWVVVNPLGGYDGEAYSHNDYVGGDSVFTGNSSGWRIENFDLSAWSGMTVQVAFVMGSDPYVTADGWYIDDVAFVQYVETGVHSDEASSRPEAFGISAHPNPFNSSCCFSIRGDSGSIESLKIYDLGGHLIDEIMVSGGGSMEVVRWSPDDSVVSGLYFARATFGGSKAVAKVLILR